jgi:hypothetical protein
MKRIEFVGGGPLDGTKTPDTGDERIGVRDGDRVYIYEREDAPPSSMAWHVLQLVAVLPIGDERRRGPTGV